MAMANIWKRGSVVRFVYSLLLGFWRIAFVLVSHQRRRYKYARAEGTVVLW